MISEEFPIGTKSITFCFERAECEEGPRIKKITVTY